MKKSLFLCLSALLLVVTGCKKEVESVTVMPESISLKVGKTYQLSAVVKPDKAPQEVRWLSSDPEVATVNAGGLVTAVAAGECEISVYADVQKAVCRVQVTANGIPVTGVSLDKDELVLAESDEVQLTATVAPDDASDKSVTWFSSDNAVATVSSDGKVTAVKAGTSTITVTTEDGGKAATCAVTVKSGLPEGPLPGLFSVSNDQQIQFSPGNLVATIDASGAPTAWKFAANQYDCLGEGGANKTIGSAAGDIDFFGWSTEATKYGISTSTNYADYSGDFRDWGKKIGDGSTWRTLSKDEWVYLFKTRSNASSLYKYGVTVCGKANCVIIAPDGYTGTIAGSYESSTWPAAEADGLICLPAAGYRYGSNVFNVGDIGSYWSSTVDDSYRAHYVYFHSGAFFPDDYVSRVNGYSVRLITDVK